MIPIETIAMFIAASMALSFAPGPDNIFVLTQSALYGRKAGLIVTLGLCTGLLFHTAAVSLGVAAIFQTSILAFTIVKFMGAAYLVYLAWKAFKAGNTDIKEAAESKIDLSKLYYRGVIMNITNPKVAIFFLAFLPQFTNAAKGSITIQMMMLGGLFIVVALFIFSMISLFAGFLGEWLKESKKAQVIINRIAGTIFIALAFRLAITER